MRQLRSSLPHCLIASLPHCLIASLPHCLIAASEPLSEPPYGVDVPDGEGDRDRAVEFGAHALEHRHAIAREPVELASVDMEIVDGVGQRGDTGRPVLVER